MSLNNHNQTLGKAGEETACQFLIHYGYEIIGRNFRCSLGEVDIIGEKNGEIIFFEVKTRSNYNYGTPAEIINYAKLKRMEQVAWIYLRKMHRENSDWGVKVIEVMQDNCNIIEPVL